jgi:4-hydroxy-tetrahydrodipicolinate synthase
MGHVEGGIRLPLTPLSPEHHDRIRAAMADAGIAS